MPDATTLREFWRQTLDNYLIKSPFEAINARLVEQGPWMCIGTTFDATVIAAPSSTKNEDNARDLAMRQEKTAIRRARTPVLCGQEAVSLQGGALQGTGREHGAAVELAPLTNLVIARKSLLTQQCPECARYAQKSLERGQVMARKGFDVTTGDPECVSRCEAINSRHDAHGSRYP